MARLITFPLCLLLTGCDGWFFEVLGRQIHRPTQVTIDDHALPFAVERIAKVLDLTTRYIVVQDRQAPNFLHAETVALDSVDTCNNFSHDAPPATRHLLHSELASLDRAFAHYENPLLIGSAFIAALAVRQEGGEKPLEVRLIGDMLRRILALSARSGELGYIPRYDGFFDGQFEPQEACRFPNGYCTTIDPGPYANDDDLYARNALIRRWEPSGDEYVGILVILAFVERYIANPEVRALNRELAAQVASYLRNHDYYLERPCPDGGFVWRGGYHIVWAHAYERVFERMGLGYRQPRFPTAQQLCTRNRVTGPAANELLPCSPVMVETYVTELSAVIGAMQAPFMHDIRTVYETYIAGTQFPFLRITGSSLNLIMFVLFAQSALFDDVKPELASFYRSIQRSNPARILPYWHGMFAYSEEPITDADHSVRAALGDDGACLGDSLPLEDEGCGWSTDVTLRCLFPMTLLAHRAGVSFDQPIARDALPLAY